MKIFPVQLANYFQMIDRRSFRTVGEYRDRSLRGGFGGSKFSRTFVRGLWVGFVQTNVSSQKIAGDLT